VGGGACSGPHKAYHGVVRCLHEPGARVTLDSGAAVVPTPELPQLPHGFLLDRPVWAHRPFPTPHALEARGLGEPAVGVAAGAGDGVHLGAGPREMGVLDHDGTGGGAHVGTVDEVRPVPARPQLDGGLIHLDARHLVTKLQSIQRHRGAHAALPGAEIVPDGGRVLPAVPVEIGRSRVRDDHVP